MFKSTDNYIASSDLTMAVNAAIALEKPLLIKGESVERNVGDYYYETAEKFR